MLPELCALEKLNSMAEFKRGDINVKAEDSLCA